MHDGFLDQLTVYLGSFVHGLVAKLYKEGWKSLLLCDVLHGEFSSLFALLVRGCLCSKLDKLDNSVVRGHESLLC
jgi:hypothetical protein